MATPNALARTAGDPLAELQRRIDQVETEAEREFAAPTPAATDAVRKDREHQLDETQGWLVNRRDWFWSLAGTAGVPMQEGRGLWDQTLELLHEARGFAAVDPVTDWELRFRARDWLSLYPRCLTLREVDTLPLVYGPQLEPSGENRNARECNRTRLIGLKWRCDALRRRLADLSSYLNGARNAVAEQSAEIGTAVGGTLAPSLTPPGAPELEPEILAIALLVKHRDWSLAQIADRLGVDRKTLYKWEGFRDAAEKAGKLTPRRGGLRSLPHGHKTEGRTVEAYGDNAPGDDGEVA
jgi:hypothetical protein